MEYVKFKLTPGQQPPSDGKCWGIAIPSTEWLVWQGEGADVFPSAALEHADMDAAEIASVQPQAITRAAAKAHLDAAMDAQQALLRALGLTTLAEVNIVRAWLVSFKTEVAAAVSLADLKTRIATLPATPYRTKAQLIQAIKNKLDTGEAT